MPNQIRDINETFVDNENTLIFEKNVSVPLKWNGGVLRVNVYRPQAVGKYPSLVTYGPYGKDIHYGDFHAKSFSEVNPVHKSKYSAWETPDPVFWTKHGYVVVRADEQGLGQSPGVLDTMSASTANSFFDLIEWTAVQDWCSGKVGLLGVSYYAGSQWRVAAKRPKGLAAIVPHEGMSDYYRDRCRHGGILSNNFIDFWWNRQVITNQYGRPGRSKSRWGDDTIEGDLDAAELAQNCRDQNVDNATNPFLDDEYHASKVFRLEDIEVPLLSVANWGGNTLHLRGNVEGYTWAGSKHKFLRFIVGRHDLPFYYDEEVEVHRSFLEAFLKDNDYAGWKSGKMPPVSVCLRKGNVGFNNPDGEKTFSRREEMEWPIARTEYTKFFLTPDMDLNTAPRETSGMEPSVLSYDAGHSSEQGTKVLEFRMPPVLSELEVTGHVLAHLAVSVDSSVSPPPEKLDLDLFLTLRHFSAAGKEIPYTGSSGDAVPVTKGWLRTSMRRVNPESPYHRPYLPRREYRSIDVQPVQSGVVYECDVELWPTDVVVEEGGWLTLQVSSEDTEPGVGLFKHNSPIDRPPAKFSGTNSIHFDGHENYLLLPVIP
ncbi:alpha/beta-hydrolase [Aspergillus sclerotiicarbonarius CBS 121057]|uniref:Alpha/beta-hydrolase n=1 Tax=Aspergillus sclerotiicarbonarius (strain CBS 121057 / IBT 28362) TaxID=1448318 RepID=A0A319EMY1_ASPSB|nr:alpha/beta-hydrolase [Aspergillus sclerotiicarbonarius CBS 121057]